MFPSLSLCAICEFLFANWGLRIFLLSKLYFFQLQVDCAQIFCSNFWYVAATDISYVPRVNTDGQINGKCCVYYYFFLFLDALVSVFLISDSSTDAIICLESFCFETLPLSNGHKHNNYMIHHSKKLRIMFADVASNFPGVILSSPSSPSSLNSNPSPCINYHSLKADFKYGYSVNSVTQTHFHLRIGWSSLNRPYWYSMASTYFVNVDSRQV